MIGESLEDFIVKNKKTRREKAVNCLNFLRGLTDDNIKKNPCAYFRTLSFLLGLINDKDPFDQISMEEIGTSQTEIRSFEEKSLIIESKNCFIRKSDTLPTKQ
jgi:hypothetical protein